MNKLSNLRKQLAILRRRRQAARWTTAWSALVLAVIVAGLCLFAVDWALEMTRPQRVVALLLASVAVLWAFRRYTLPLLANKETELDMALLVERQQRIDSDLVAALQFESEEARKWGSPQLEAAVIDYVAEYGRGWDVLEGFDRRQIVRRLGALAAAMALVLLAVVLFPGHARTFFNRMAMGSMHYPTDTQIDQIAINGQPVEFSGGKTAVMHSAFGQPLRLTVHASQVLPESGHVQLTTLASSAQREVELPRSSDVAESSATYEAVVPQLLDSISLQAYLGDAYSEPVEVHVIPLPAVDVTLTPTPPAYAQLAEHNDAPSVNSRQLSVLEGSRIDLALSAVNKPLQTATVTINKEAYPLTRQDGEGKQWTLEENTPLARVTDEVRYEIQVTDEDGLQLQQPIVGAVRIKADRKPTVVASMETLHVLPSATPKIDYRALDDFGIAKLVLNMELVRVSAAGEPAETTPLPAVTVYDRSDASSGEMLQSRLTGSAPLPLSKYKLEKDDQVRLTLAVTDYRGDAEGETVTSEPLTLNVTDLSGVYAAMYELEEKAYRQTNALIDRQTETGGSK